MITGDNIVFDGISGGGSAVAGTLSPGTTLTGKLVITGNNITIRGVKFLNTSAEKTISFAGPSSNLKLIDCEFVGNDGSYANSQKSKFWMGANYSGDANPELQDQRPQELDASRPYHDQFHPNDGYRQVRVHR